MSVETVQLKVGDRFWVDAKTCGLGKPYWFKVTEVTESGVKLVKDGEYIESSNS